MGLDDWIKDAYPKTFGRINCWEGVPLALQQDKQPSFSLEAECVLKQSYWKVDSLDITKDLAYLLLLIKAIPAKDLNGAWTSWVRAHPFSLYSREGRTTFENVIEIFSNETAYEWIKSFPSEPAEALVNAMRPKKPRHPRKLFKLAKEFISTLHNFPQLPSEEPRLNASTLFNIESVLLFMRRRNEGAFFSKKNVYRHHLEICDRKERSGSIVACLNSSVKDMLAFNKIDCCVAGTEGKSRDAPIIYFLDPAVHILGFKKGVRQDGTFSPSGIGIFTEAGGYHVANQTEKYRYLVLEGFPANTEWYLSFDCINPQSLTFEGIRDLKIKSLSVADFVYVLGLITAHMLHIPKIFINTEHSGGMRSVDDVVHAAAIQASLPQESWEIDRNKKLKLLKDPYTKGSFQVLRDPVSGMIILDTGQNTFEYTHVFKKPQLSNDLIQKIRYNEEWNGEGFFDTFYAWNKFIMETYPKWSSELKKIHPYAENVWRHGKDPQWNLGIGYCKGFEVDVEKECKRLGIS